MAQITGALVHDGNHTALGYKYSNITATTAGTTINSSPGILHSITFNTPLSTSVVTLYDNTAASGTVIGTVTVSASQTAVTLFYNVNFTIGLTIKVATAACDLTVAYI